MHVVISMLFSIDKRYFMWKERERKTAKKVMRTFKFIVLKMIFENVIGWTVFSSSSSLRCFHNFSCSSIFMLSDRSLELEVLSLMRLMNGSLVHLTLIVFFRFYCCCCRRPNCKNTAKRSVCHMNTQLRYWRNISSAFTLYSYVCRVHSINCTYISLILSVYEIGVLIFLVGACSKWLRCFIKLLFMMFSLSENMNNVLCSRFVLSSCRFVKWMPFMYTIRQRARHPFKRHKTLWQSYFVSSFINCRSTFFLSLALSLFLPTWFDKSLAVFVRLLFFYQFNSIDFEILHHVSGNETIRRNVCTCI